MTRDTRQELNTIFRLAWPTVIQEILATVVTYVDTAMVGSLGASASASVGLCGTVNWLMGSLAGSLGVGVMAVCAQADGAKQPEKLQKAGQQALFLTLISGILIALVCVVLAPVLPTWLGADPSIRRDASAYFLIISAPYLFRSATIVLSAALRGVSDMKTPMYINLFMNGVNVVLNFFLIYPTRRLWGILVPGAGMGVIGAAIATAISITVGGTLMFLRYLRHSQFRFRETGFHYDRKIMGSCLSIGFPVAVQRGIICMGHVVFSGLISGMGVIPFAAHTIAIQAEQAFYIPGYGFQSAASTLVGNAIGQKNESRVRKISLLTCAIACILMTVAGIALFLLAPALMSFFTPDESVIRLGAAVLRIVALSEPIYGILVILEGVFNGMGDTKAPVVFAVITMWGVRVLGTIIVTRLLGLGLEWVWGMMVLDNVLRCCMLALRFAGGKWRKQLKFI